MKSAMLKMMILCVCTFLLAAVTTHGQITDTGFVNNTIRQQIIEIKLAQLALTRGERPHLKQAARDIIENDRASLEKMLTFTQRDKLPSVTQSQLNELFSSMNSDSAISGSDQRSEAATGNTVTDSLGSGSTGSGNVSGTDSATVSKTGSDKRNADYSETGNDYAYNNESFLTETERLSGLEGRQFERQWVALMLKMHKGKLQHYERVEDSVKNTELKMAIMEAIRRARLNHDVLARMSRGKYGPAKGLDQTMQGPGEERNNRRGAGR